MKYNAIRETKIVYFAQQFSTWFMTKNMEFDAEGKTLSTSAHNAKYLYWYQFDLR